jgi:hypothetical protein
MMDKTLGGVVSSPEIGIVAPTGPVSASFHTPLALALRQVVGRLEQSLRSTED